VSEHVIHPVDRGRWNGVAEPATVDDLEPGDHACLTFSDADERLDIVAAFVRDGLERGDKVVCLTDLLRPDELSADLSERGLPVEATRRSGQLEVLSSVSEYIASGTFDPGHVISGLRSRIDGALQQGYPGLRISADMVWALRPVDGLEQLLTFEVQFTELLATRRAMAVCQYDREGFDPLSLAGASAAHSRAVAAVTYHSDAVLRICRQHIPPGVRIAGELDYRSLDPLNRALAEAVRLDSDVFLNLAHLRFIDVAAAGVLLQTALGLAGGKAMTVVCQPAAGKVIRALGGDQLPALRLVVRDVGQ
jgi:anti-anti-sigma regulatory factor